MLRHRVIPVLLVKDHGLVKTQQFRDPKYVGDPINALRIFNEKEADELVLLDIAATSSGRGPNFSLVEDVASECFMPLGYGGGVRSPDDARRLFGLGVEKVILRTAAISDLRTLTSIAAIAGSSSVAVSIDVKKNRLGRRRLHAPGTALDETSDYLGVIRRAIDAGAGEIVLNSVDKDGTMSGPDLELISTVSSVSSVPVVAIGGVGSLDDIRAAVNSGADAVGAGAFFVYHGPRRAVLITYPSYSDLSRVLGTVE